MDTKSDDVRKLAVIQSIHTLPGVDTLEGKIGPIISSKKGSAHFIIMHPDLYCPAHSHATESIIYTAKGAWILFADGKRHIMPEGSLFYMPPDIETGYEVPFDEPATLLISKFEGPMNPDEFIIYLHGLADRLLDDEKSGNPYTLSALPPKHPARIFAHSVNPNKYV